MGPVTPRVSKEGKLRADRRGLGPPEGSGTSCARPDSPHHVGVRSRHVSRRRGIVRESSAGRLAHPPHLMRWTRRALPPRYTRQPLSGPAVHRVLPRSTVEPPVPHPRSPPAALNGYDSTALFHHVANAASYTARLSNVAGDVTSYDRLRLDKTAPGHDGRRAPGAGEGIQERSPLPATP